MYSDITTILKVELCSQLRHTIHCSHQMFGEVIYQITNFKSPNLLFQVTKMCCIIQLQVWYAYQNWIIHHILVNWNRKIDRFKIGDLIGDFTKKLVTRMDGAPKALAFTWLEFRNFQARVIIDKKSVLPLSFLLLRLYSYSLHLSLT